MKFGKAGQAVLVSAIALLVATLFTACGTFTVGFLYVPAKTASPGVIQVYEVNSESGVLRTIPTSPFPSGGRVPISEAVSTDFKTIYVANNEDNNIVQFTIGTDGKLYPQSTVNTPGTFPMAIVTDTASQYLYVVDTLGPVAGCTLTNPCPGVIAGFTVTPNTSTVNPASLGLSPASCASVPAPSPLPNCTLGNPITNSNELTYVSLLETPTDTADVLAPTALELTPDGKYAFVAAYNSVTSRGYLFLFSIGSTGALTQLGGYPLLTGAGSDPVALTVNSTSSALYVLDQAKATVAGYSIAALVSDAEAADSAPPALPAALGTAKTGTSPSAFTLHGDNYLYVANSGDSNVTAYSLASTTSATAFTTIASYATGSQPIAITVDPRHVGFLYTLNFLTPSLSGFQINATNGTLLNTQNSPYGSSPEPTTIAGVPHNGSVH